MSTNNNNIKILCIGNPLLDISTSYVDIKLLEKYNLKLDDAILANEKQLLIYDEIINDSKYKIEYIPGGAEQNTSRICQWMLNGSGNVCYIGCIGNDENGKILKKETELNGVLTKYQIDELLPTGACAVLNVNEGGSGGRTMITNLGAANNFNISHLKSNEINSIIKSCKIYYSSGYFLTVSLESLIYICEESANSNDKLFTFCLGSPFIINNYFDRLLKILPYIDILFLRESEAILFSNKMNWNITNDDDDDQFKYIGEKLLNFEKNNKSKSRIIIFTNGQISTKIYSTDNNNKLIEFKPINIVPENEIIDLNATGDAFFGGFIAAYSLGKDLKTCCESAQYCLFEILKQKGCTIPSNSPSFKLI